MSAQGSVGTGSERGASQFVGRVFALVVGFLLMIVGLAMGVTVVMLPVGIPLGLVGLVVFFWGLFGWSQEKQLPTQPPV